MTNGQSMEKMSYIQAIVEFSDPGEIEHIDFIQFNSLQQLEFSFTILCNYLLISFRQVKCFNTLLVSSTQQSITAPDLLKTTCSICSLLGKMIVLPIVS